jgi:ABC-2 type transport system permease protein
MSNVSPQPSGSRTSGSGPSSSGTSGTGVRSTDRVTAEAGDARIFDRGYRRYEGERAPVRGAIFTLYLASLQRILGLRRGAKSKILPVLTIAISYLPAISFIGIASLLPGKLTGALPNYNEYYGFIITAIVLFVAFVAPEALCPDRRYKILGVYLASPLNRTSYVIAKLLSVLTVLSIVTIGPMLLLAIARTLLDIGPALKDLPLLLLRIVASGTVVSLFFGCLSLAISSMTDRKGFASAGFVLLTIVTQAVGGILGFNHFELRKVGALISIVVSPIELVQRIFGASPAVSASTPVVAAVVFGITIASGIVLFLRYKRLEVTR